MTYTNRKVVVTPYITGAAVGDMIRITSNRGEFALKFTNALTNDGPFDKRFVPIHCSGLRLVRLRHDD